MVQIHPDVEKLVYTEPGNVICLETLSSQVFPANIKVTFKWRYAPAKWPIGNHGTTALELYPYEAFHTEQGPH